MYIHIIIDVVIANQRKRSLIYVTVLNFSLRNINYDQSFIFLLFEKKKTIKEGIPITSNLKNTKQCITTSEQMFTVHPTLCFFFSQ